MRLGTLLLTPAALTAQATLPWDGTASIPWEMAVPEAPPAAFPSEPPPASSLHVVSLSKDGTLRISDTKGRVLLRLGLPGRPVHLLRDAGIPMTLDEFPSAFPADTALFRGIGALPLAGDDFRPALRGLLWILDDGERRITVVHPATQQVVYLPLPIGQDWAIHMYPDRLEVREKTTSTKERREIACWSVPWLVLLPQFIRLSLPPALGQRGTAFHPFPSE